MNTRRLQNGIGTASVLGIVVILSSLALDPGSPPTATSPAIASGSPTPLTSTGDGAPPSGMSTAPLATIAPSATPTTSSSGSLRPPTHTNNDTGTLPNAAGTTPPTISSNPLHGVTALRTTTSDPPASGTLVPTTTTTQPPVSAVSTTTTTTTTAPTSTVPTRQVKGTAVTLGAGSFLGGTDVAPGLYDVTPGPDQSGTFIVNGTDSYDEILDSSGTQGVPKIRVQISNSDQIQISGLSQVIFTPVSTPFVTSHSAVTLYAGTWTVGQDLGPGRYVATPGAGQSGNFIITSEGINEVLGGDPSRGGVPSVTFNVQSGDVIEIIGLRQVTLAPS